MKKRTIATLLAATAAAVCLALPAMAATVTSSDGVLSIELPSDDWKELVDPSKWIAFSDGANLITIEHFSNGEKLPDFAVADSRYVNTVIAAYTTQNEVFIATGFVTDPAVMNTINDALYSIKILKYDTKQAVSSAAAATGVYTIVPRDMMMYVRVSSDNLSVRNGYSVDSELIGALENGAYIHVTGVVQLDGADYGWYQISFNNGTGFVSAAYLSAEAPAAFSAPAASSSSQSAASQSTASQSTASASTESSAAASDYVETYLVYSQGSGRPVNITGSNGVFYDGSGNVYYSIGGGNFTDEAGAYYSTTVPASAPDTEVIGLVSDGSGRPVTIMENEDGSYSDEEGNEYYQQEDGSYVDDYDATYQVSGTNEEY